jgi:Ca-activated chloride channel family protein
MFDFAHPWLLLLGLAIPPLLWWWLWQPRAAFRYSDIRPLASLPGGRRRWATWASAVLRCGALVLLVLGLAGPRWADARQRLSTEGIAIEILVDVSGSMAEEDFEWNKKRISRLDAVKKVFHLFVNGGVAPGGERLAGRPNDLIGLVVFATRPKPVCPPTLSHDGFPALLKEEQPRVLPDEGRTNIGDAIALGVKVLTKVKPSRKILVLLTDGEHNVETLKDKNGKDVPVLKPRQAAQLAAAEGITIYAIDAGGESAGSEGEKEDESRSAEDRANAVKILKAVSEKMTKGKYFQAQNTQALIEVYHDIDRLERQEIESFQYRYFSEGFAWFGLGSLFLWVLVHLLEWTFWRRAL